MNARSMTMWITLASAGPVGITAAADKSPDASQEVAIHFAGHLSINDWQPDSNHGLWIQDEHFRWYYARLMDPCQGLDHADVIAFDTRPGGPFDRFSSVIVPHEYRCHLQSLVRSGPPPKKVRKPAAASAHTSTP